MSQVMAKKEINTAENANFNIGRGELLKALSHVQSVVEKRGTIPILSNIKIDVVDGSIELTATDMEIAVMDSVPADVSQVGSFTVQAHMLYEIVRKLPDDADVSFVEDKNAQKVNIKAGSAKFSLATLPVDEFPNIGTGILPNSFSISKDECRILIEKTRFAMSNEETRYYLNGVYLHEAESDGLPILRAVATDGHRLSRADVPLPAGAAGITGCIIPRKTIGEIGKLLEDAPAEIKISTSESKIRFEFGNTILFSKLIDGNFPDYNRVIPANNDIILEIGTVLLAKAVDRISVISSEKVRGVKLQMENNIVTVSNPSTDQNQGEEKIEANYAAEPLSVGFNSKYLGDVLGQIESDIVRFALSNGGASLVSDPKDDSVIYVIMPMRV
jgi:DNA polymerase-3 subunit beta